jgi:hypothetical protein
MIVVDVLLAANLAVLAVLVVADRSKSHRPRPLEVLAAARDIQREAVKSPRSDHVPGCGGVIVPFDRAARHGSPAYDRHSTGTAATLRHPAGGNLRH